MSGSQELPTSEDAQNVNPIILTERKNQAEKNEIPYGYCHCGCGQKTNIALSNNKANRQVKGLPLNFIQYHKLSREMAANWKGGRVIDATGYVRIVVKWHPKASKCGGYHLEHILMAEKVLGRFLKRSEVVHHVDENRQHNVNSNFVICDRALHKLIHYRIIALRICGHADWKKCWLCKTYSDPIDLVKNKGRNAFYHHDCMSVYGRNQYLKNKVKKG